MGKRYYCEYCDRSFKDDVEARKKHLNSLQHAKNRANHYSAFKDPQTILKEEYEKSPCKRYMTVGDCAFGLGCRFSHYTPPMIWELERLVAIKNSKELTAVPKNGWPNSQDIVEEYLENIAISESKEESRYQMSNACTELQDNTHVPPSLRPVTSENIVDCNFRQWA